MQYRRLGRTELMVSEVGLGGEWLERHNAEEVKAVIDRCEEHGVNILDCWMSNPEVRSNIGAAIRGKRERWYIQGHFGSIWRNGQYEKSRDMAFVRPAFEDLLARLGTDYIDLGMIYFVDSREDWELIRKNGYLDYVLEQKAKGVVRHIGMSTHNPQIAKLGVESGIAEMLLFSVNPAFDLLSPSENIIDRMLAERFTADGNSIDPERAELYHLCEQNDVGITVMKGYAGGRLFDASRSPFGVSLTPVQCIHYALTRPAVCSVLTGCETPEQVDEACAYETASDEEKDYATVLANAPLHAYSGQCTYCGHCKPCPVDIDIALVNKYYDLAVMQPEVPASVKDHYLSQKHPAGDCIGCRSCETRCPFGVKIAERMKKAAELFGK